MTACVVGGVAGTSLAGPSTATPGRAWVRDDGRGRRRLPDHLGSVSRRPARILTTNWPPETSFQVRPDRQRSRRHCGALHPLLLAAAERIERDPDDGHR